MDKTKDLEEDANVNESQFQEFLQFCSHVNPSKQEIRKHCMLNHIDIRREQTEKRRQLKLNLINVRRGYKEMEDKTILLEMGMNYIFNL